MENDAEHLGAFPPAWFYKRSLQDVVSAEYLNLVRQHNQDKRIKKVLRTTGGEATNIMLLSFNYQRFNT